MFRPRVNVKADPEARWRQSDRVFFGFGACHILAGVFLEDPPLPVFYAEWIVPEGDFPGAHFYVTDGHFAFDFRGYSLRANLLGHHWRGHERLYCGWDATVAQVDFDLLDTAALNARRHRGPDQYFADPSQRARRFIDRIPPPK